MVHYVVTIMIRTPSWCFSVILWYRPSKYAIWKKSVTCYNFTLVRSIRKLVLKLSVSCHWRRIFWAPNRIFLLKMKKSDTSACHVCIPSVTSLFPVKLSHLKLELIFDKTHQKSWGYIWNISYEPEKIVQLYSQMNMEFKFDSQKLPSVRIPSVALFFSIWFPYKSKNGVGLRCPALEVHRYLQLAHSF